MKINLQWWLDWTAWAMQRAVQLSGSVSFPKFADDVRNVADQFVHALDSIPFGKPLRLFAWALANPDPFKSVRDAAIVTRRRWLA